MHLRVLTWNLKHGRSVPPSQRELLDEFGAALHSWEWDVALLQEVPPWWPEPLARATHADFRAVRTSRNFGLAVRRAIATRHPDLIKSNGGGANAILVRGEIRDHRAQRLCRLPERRWAQGVQLADGSWAVNLHASNTRNALRDTQKAARGPWGSPLLFGGDTNVTHPQLPGLVHLGGNHVDHLFSDGRPATRVEVLERGTLSDHAPVRVTL